MPHTSRATCVCVRCARGTAPGDGWAAVRLRGPRWTFPRERRRPDGGVGLGGPGVCACVDIMLVFAPCLFEMRGGHGDISVYLVCHGSSVSESGAACFCVIFYCNVLRRFCLFCYFVCLFVLFAHHCRWTNVQNQDQSVLLYEWPFVVPLTKKKTENKKENRLDHGHR